MSTNENLGVIVPARMSSTRLPGKVLMPLGGLNPIQRIYGSSIDAGIKPEKIVIATSTDKTDDALSHWSKENGISCFRGSLNNVAKRYLDCAEQYGFDFSIRINADNIFINSRLLRKVAILSSSFKFISNVRGRTYPYGMSLEGVSTNYLNKHKAKIFSNQKYYEHICSYFYTFESVDHHFIYNTKTIDEEYKNLALDTAEDYRKLSALLINENESLNKIYDQISND